MNNIKMVKDEVGNIYLSQEDLMGILAARLERFPDDLEKLKKPKAGNIVTASGQATEVESDPVEVAHVEGMQKMLEGVLSIINITDEDEQK